jgi:hypothetical protein
LILAIRNGSHAAGSPWGLVDPRFGMCLFNPAETITRRATEVGAFARRR